MQKKVQTMLYSILMWTNDARDCEKSGITNKIYCNLIAMSGIGPKQETRLGSKDTGSVTAKQHCNSV